MTTQQIETTSELAVTAAAAAAAVLPSSEPLTAAAAQPGTEHVISTFAGAAIADLEPAGTGRIAVLVAEDLVGALASSPLGGLDLAAATQPALDAVARALGVTTGAARSVDLQLVVADLGAFTAVPLLGTGFAAAVLISDSALSAAASASEVAPAPVPAATFPTQAPVVADARPTAPTPPRGIEMLHGVDMEVTVELGRTRMTVRDLLALSPGTVLELDRAAGSPADLLVNGRLIARGEVVVLDEDFGLRVTEIVDDAAAS
jgi:flagellar motor switch protein FliN/FliY